MNRIQFLIVTIMSGLIALLLIVHIFLTRQCNFEQNRLGEAQQVVTQGQAFQSNLKQLALRIYQLGQQTQDQGLKDLLARQDISITNNGGSTNAAPSTDSSAPSTNH